MFRCHTHSSRTITRFPATPPFRAVPTLNMAAGLVADKAVALIHLLLGSSPGARHGHPAAVGNDPAFLFLVADDGAQYRHCNVGLLAYAQTVHDQVEENINADRKSTRLNSSH